jgi:hypothetical protein
MDKTATEIIYHKGDRVRAQWFATHLTSLAGVQMKFGATIKDVVGTVRHIRGDHPIHPTEVRVYLDPDLDSTYDGPKVDLVDCTCGHPHVELKPAHIIEVL